MAVYKRRQPSREMRSCRFADWRIALALSAFLTAFEACPTYCAAQLCGQFSGVNLSENFNTLITAGSSQLSNGFEFAFSENPGNLTYSGDNGSDSNGNTYSYGTTGSSDRALGELTSSSVQSTIGACFVNNTNHAITSFLISYAGEQWRLAAADANVDRLDFQYSTEPGATLTSGTYIDVNALDFNAPNNSSVGALNGNSAANRTVFAPLAITPSSPIQPEATFFIRWRPVLIAGTNTNDGLAIDDFTIGATLGAGVAGDYNNNGVVDAADYVRWRNMLNQAATIPNDITPGTVVMQDYTEWLNRFGKSVGEFGGGSAVPEPAAFGLIMASCGVGLGTFRRVRTTRS
jgi:hypothetical protein